MKTNMKLSYILLVAAVGTLFSACQSEPIAEESLYATEAEVVEITKDGKLFTLNQFVDSFMTEVGNYHSDTTNYRTAANNEAVNPGLWLFSIDTLPTNGPGIYIRGRVTTDDYGGNFYKSMVIQQIVDGKQQALRLSVDAGSVSGMYPRGQQILIRCNGFAIGKYANQVQLCVPSHNNNVWAQNADRKVGWAPGRIPFARFKAATTRIGQPDAKKLVYEVRTVSDITASLDPKAARKEDGKLVSISNIYYTGQCQNDSRKTAYCTWGNPTKDKTANVFAPTTKNVGHPQSRFITDGSSDTISVSMSEYAKEAHFFLPGANNPYYDMVAPYDSVSTEAAPTTPYLSFTADGTTYYVRVDAEKQADGWIEDDVVFINDTYSKGYVFDGTNWSEKVGVLHCTDYKGTVTGILSYYMDNANYDPSVTNWAISICDLSDLDLKDASGEKWVPVEYTNYTPY